MRRLIALIALLALAAAGSLCAQSEGPPVRLAIVGLVHDHARGFIPSLAGRRDDPPVVERGGERRRGVDLGRRD